MEKKDKIYKILSVIAVIAIMITIFCLSAEDADDSKETSSTITILINKFFGDIPEGTVRTIAHCCEFAALGFFMYNAFYAFQKRSPVVSALTSFLYAVTDETHQYFVPGRTFQIIDLTVDFAGIVAGTIAILILLKLIELLKKKKSCDSK